MSLLVIVPVHVFELFQALPKRIDHRFGLCGLLLDGSGTTEGSIGG